MLATRVPAVQTSRRLLLLLLPLASATISCVVPDLDVTGKSCPAGTCPGGFACDATTSTCVRGAPAPDWTAAFTAVYQFEDRDDVGLDATDHGHHLASAGLGSVRGSVDAGVAGKFAQFDSSSRTAYLSAAAGEPDFDTTEGTSFSTGGWFFIMNRPPADQAQHYLIHNIDFAHSGFRLFTYPTITDALCEVGVTESGHGHASTSNGGRPNEWVHLACRYQDEQRRVMLFVDGREPDGDDITLTDGIAGGAVPLELGSGEALFAFDGYMDEVFFVRRALDDRAMSRIWACGIDGRRCVCSSADPHSYATCGRAAQWPTPCDRSALPACDAPTPSGAAG